MTIFSKYTSNKESFQNLALEPEVWSFLEKIAEIPATIQEIASEYNIDYATAESFINQLLDLRICVNAVEKVGYDEWKNSQCSSSAPSIENQDSDILETKTHQPSSSSKVEPTPISTNETNQIEEPKKIEEVTQPSISLEIGNEPLLNDSTPNIIHMPKKKKVQQIAFEIS